MRASVERPSKKQVGTRRAPYTAPTYLAKARHGRRCGGPNTSPIHLKRDRCATRPHMKREIGLCNVAGQIMTFLWNTEPILAVKSFGTGEHKPGTWEGLSMTSRGSKSEHSTSRRRFLLAAGATGAATVAAPAVVSAQGPISMRWQSTWPSKDIFHEYALDYAKKVNDMTGGDLKIEVLPAGAVVPAFQLLDAVSKG